MAIDRKSKLWIGPSNSEAHAANKSNLPELSGSTIKSVSAFRRETLATEADNGLFRNGNISKEGTLTQNSNVLTYSSLKKTSQVTSSGSGSFRGPGDTVRQNQEIYSPLWINSNQNLPRDRATINAWCRSFYALNPFVHNAINLHSTYPINKLNIKCPNKEIENFFNDMIEELDLMNICVQIAQEFWLLGEAFVHADYDQVNGKWSRLVIQNPDYMILQPTVSINDPNIMMRPDQHLKTIVTSNKPADIEQKKQLPQYIIDAVKRNQNIPLNNFNISHLARKISPYETRGTGLPVCVFRQLMLMDMLRESKFAQAEDQINPLTVVKIGSADYKPTFADLESWRDQFAQAKGDKDFKVFTHEGVDISRVGHAANGALDINPDIEALKKELYIGLQVPSVIMDGGGDITYQNGGVSLDVLRQRYMQFRNMMAIWLKRKIFAPISKIREFYDYSGGEKKLIVPEIDWNHMSLFDAGDYITTLTSLMQGDDGTPGKKKVSVHTLYRSLGLEYEDEVRKIRKEAIQNEIFKKEQLSLEAMDLTALRALEEEDEIPEPQKPADGQQPADAVPGEAPTGLPGLDMGAPPSPAPEAPAPTPEPAA